MTGTLFEPPAPDDVPDHVLDALAPEPEEHEDPLDRPRRAPLTTADTTSDERWAIMEAHRPRFAELTVVNEKALAARRPLKTYFRPRGEA